MLSNDGKPMNQPQDQQDQFVRSLLSVLKPPPRPVDVDCEYWTYHRNVMQIDLPSDYDAFCNLYGSGTLQTPAISMQIISPFRPTYPAIVLYISRVWNRFRDSCGIDDVPFGLFPEAGGFLPFAITWEGGAMGWIVDGEPAEWKVVDMSQYELGQLDILDMSFSEYVYYIVTCQRLPQKYSSMVQWTSSDVTYTNQFKIDSAFAPRGQSNDPR